MIKFFVSDMAGKQNAQIVLRGCKHSSDKEKTSHWLCRWIDLCTLLKSYDIKAMSVHSEVRLPKFMCFTDLGVWCDWLSSAPKWIQEKSTTSPSAGSWKNTYGLGFHNILRTRHAFLQLFPPGRAILVFKRHSKSHNSYTGIEIW